MQGTNQEWSQAEKQVAKIAFQTAQDREMNALVQGVRSEASSVKEIEDVWKLHDFLSAKRHDIDGKYDYRYSALIFVFAQLVREKWLSLDELSGLNSEKISKIAALSRM